MNEELTKQLKYLRLNRLLAHWEDYLHLAAEKDFSHARLLSHIVEEEYQLKRENARKLRIQKAAIPEPWTIESFPFAKQPKLNKKKLMALYDSLDYMTLGRTGCGKTGLAISFLTHAIDHGYNGRYVLFAELINELYASAADRSEQKVLKKYLSYDCLLIDEIGYVEVEPHQVGLFFTLMQQRHNKKSTLITSNLGFSQWSLFLKNDHLTAALVDRLTENSHVINMKGCRSLREKLSPEDDLSVETTEG